MNALAGFFLIMRSSILFFLCLWPLSHTQLHSRILSRLEMVRSLVGFRPPVGRLIGFGYAHSEQLASESKLRKERRAWLSALSQGVKRHPEAVDMERSAIMAFVASDLDKTVRLLKSIVATQPHNSHALSDLSAAYLSRGYDNRSTIDLMRGLAAAKKALELNPTLQEALFNRAVALDMLQLKSKAYEAWGKFLLSDHDSLWAKEARVHRKASRDNEADAWRVVREKFLHSLNLSQSKDVSSLVYRFPQAAYVLCIDTLLPNWAASISSGQYAKAKQIGSLVKRIGLDLFRLTSDSQMVAIADELRSAAEDPMRRESLIQGYRLYREGRDLQEHYYPTGALSALSRASKKLAYAQSSLGCWAGIYRAVVFMDLNMKNSALEALDDSDLKFCNKYPVLAAKKKWIRGMLLFKMSQPVLALVNFQEASKVYGQIYFWEDLCASHYLAAETLEYLGSTRNAEEHLWVALSLSNKIINSWRAFALFDELANVAQEEGLPEVALDFRDRVVEVLKNSDDPVGLAHALRRRAETLATLSHTAESLTNLQQALTEAHKIGDAVERRRINAATALGMGEALIAVDPLRALEYLATASNFYEKEADHFELPRTYLAQYKGFSAIKRYAQADRAIAKEIAWFKSQKSVISDWDWGESFASRLDAVFDSIIDRHLVSGNLELSLQYAEQRLSLLATPFLAASIESGKLGKSGVDVADVSIKKLQNALPEGVEIIVYIGAPGKTGAWSVSHSRAMFRELNVGTIDLSHMVDEYYAGIAESLPREQRQLLLKKVYNEILGPVLMVGEGIKRLIIVPSKELARVPFSAAINPLTGKHVIENFSLEIAPSALSVLRKGSLGEPKKEEYSILAVGNPEVNHQVVPMLPSLAYATEEAHSIRTLYSRGILLLGRAASREAVLRELARCSVAHIGAHVFANDRFPGRSFIALSPSSAADAGLLYPKDIKNLRLNNVRLVVLGSCRGVYRTSGQLSSLDLIQPLLSAGVDTVVASLSDIDDLLASKILPIIHRKFIETGDPVSALRDSQIELLKGADVRLKDESTWSTLVAFR